MDGFNLEQLVDDEPIHMVFKSLSVSEAINLQDTLHLSSTLTDSTVEIVQNTPNTQNYFREWEEHAEFVGENFLLRCSFYRHQSLPEHLH